MCQDKNSNEYDNDFEMAMEMHPVLNAFTEWASMLNALKKSPIVWRMIKTTKQKAKH